MLRAPFVYRARFRDRAAGRSAAHFLSIVCIFRNEAVHLDEWLRFHIGMGVDHFYLYNNFSADDFAAVLEPYIGKGLVTLYDWPVKAGQLQAYRHCVKTHALDSIWMAFIDADEFLFSPDCISLRDILPAYAEFPAVMVHSPFFGSSGIDARPPVPITRAFTKRAPLSRASAKTIANPRWIYAIRDVHAFKYWRGTAVDTDMKPFDASKVRLDKLRLNHYWSRSLQDLADKIARGDAFTTTKRDPQWHYQFEAELNGELDLSILPCLRKVFPD